MTDLIGKAAAHLDHALRDDRGRSAELVVRDGVLRQSVIALRAGTELSEHNSPPAASLLVLRGQVRVTGQATEEVGEGHLVLLAHQRHAVAAITDAVFLLTTVTSVAVSEEATRDDRDEPAPGSDADGTEWGDPAPRDVDLGAPSPGDRAPAATPGTAQDPPPW